MNKILKASLDWINANVFPDAGFVHPNDENKVKCAALAFKELSIAIDKQEVIAYCNDLGMPQESIDKIVDWYGRSNGLHLKYGMRYSSKDLKEIWSQKED